MKTVSIRWTVNQAATEFGLDRRTVATRVKTSGAVPATDGCFSTAQITQALHGDLAGEKLRLLRAQADLAEVERDAALKTRIPLEVVGALTEELFGVIAAVIKAAPLGPREKEEIFAEIRGYAGRLAAKGYTVPATHVADAASKVP